MSKRIGSRTVAVERNVYISSFSSAVGPKEAEGPLAKLFDRCFKDELIGEKSFEKAESRLQQTAVKNALQKCGLTAEAVDMIFAGDLLNQCIGSAYGLRELGIPFLGLYGACSTMALSITAAAMSVDGGFSNRSVAVTSSHFCSSERQFRFPLEYGGQRPPTSQWTVTGAGAAVLTGTLKGPRVKEFTVGKIIDFGVTDMNNMGAAMAPAAADTIEAFLSDTGTKPQEYDLILTGDLGFFGSELLLKLLSSRGIALENHNDCGMMIFDRDRQDVHSGGSGCGCSASVLCSYVLQKMQSGRLRNVLFCATGALMSPTACMQGESIPAIAHLVHLSAE